MVMRFSSGRIRHKSSIQTTVIDGDSIDDEGDAVGLDEIGYGPNEDEGLGVRPDDEVESDEEIDYGYVDADEDEERDEGDDENEDGLGPEDGEEAWEENILGLEGYAEL